MRTQFPAAHTENVTVVGWLLQVAEMHGELMEFNEFLQKQLLSRESQLKHLTEELVSLRGPVSTYDKMPDLCTFCVYLFSLTCRFQFHHGLWQTRL